MNITTNEELAAKCEEWQKRLRLQDWKITCRFAAGRDEVDDKFARTRMSLHFKEAIVYICPTHLIDPDWSGPHDIEATLVHELIHLHMTLVEQLIEDNKLARQSMEVAIDLIAQALVGIGS